MPHTNFQDHGLFDDETPVLVFEAPSIAEYPTAKYGNWLVVPVVLGFVAMGFVAMAFVMFCSWRQQTKKAAKSKFAYVLSTWWASCECIDHHDLPTCNRYSAAKVWEVGVQQGNDSRHGWSPKDRSRL